MQGSRTGSIKVALQWILKMDWRVGCAQVRGKGLAKQREVHANVRCRGSRMNDKTVIVVVMGWGEEVVVR